MKRRRTGRAMAMAMAKTDERARKLFIFACSPLSRDQGGFGFV